MVTTQKTSNEKRTIDYTSYDFDALRDELIDYLIETESFKDAQYVGSNIRTLVDLFSYIGSLFGYYINSAANEVFLPTAKRYNNLNKIAHLLRYDPRGTVSATLDVVASLNPEYVFGKESEYIEIPAYSQFPSEKTTQNGTQFLFTNQNSVVYMIRSFGVRPIQSQDITYGGYPLPFTAPADFFRVDGDIQIDPLNIRLPLSQNKQLRIVEKSGDPNNFRRFDTENYPMRNLNDNVERGQPFERTVSTDTFGKKMEINTPYFLVFNFDETRNAPNMFISDNLASLSDKEDDRICTLILEPTDETERFYRIRTDDMFTFQRFYVGTLGITNLESAEWEFDEFADKRSAVERIKLVINKDGNKPPLSVLVDGVIYTLSSGTLSSQRFNRNTFRPEIPFYNVNLVIDDPNDSANNYGARLEVTSKPPISNQVTIARIATQFEDGETRTGSVTVDRGQRFGDFKVIEKPPVTTSEQKAGRVFIRRDETTQRVVFNTPFELEPGEETIDYHISLTPEQNVRVWYSQTSEVGFSIFVEPNTQFEGFVNWTVTRVIRERLRDIEVVFDEPIPTSVTVNGEISNYMIQLTPSENVQVWYSEQTTRGFKILAEKEFQGKVSWSIFNYFSDDSVPVEPNSGYRQRGSVRIAGDALESGIDIELENPIPDQNYAIQLLPSKNVNVFYNNKTQNGFTIRVEPNAVDEVLVNWYVDSSVGYSFQKHGEIEFRGLSVSDTSIPGLRFENISETFRIDNLIQGDVAFSFVNVNTIVDPQNNQLSLALDPSRSSEDDVVFIVQNDLISTNGIRVFVKNDNGVWDEWSRAGTSFDVSIEKGEKIFFVRMNPDKFTVIEFGDGENWGESPAGKEIIILGLSSVGAEGNINKNTLSPRILISKYILGNEQTNFEFQKSFIDLLGLKKQEFFDGRRPNTSIIDSENTRLSNTDIIVVQNKNAFGGNEVETVEELRKNAVNYFLRQGRNVTVDDYKRYVDEVFSDYLIKNKILTYNEIMNAGLIDEEEIPKYWFNHIFIVGLNKDGSNVIGKELRDFLISKLDNSSAKMIGTEHEIVTARWVPIDVSIKYRKTTFGSSDIIETSMRKNIKDFFNPNNFELGSFIRHSDITEVCNVQNVDFIEVMINKDPQNRFNRNDYDVDIFDTGNSERESHEIRRNKLLELVAKDSSLVKIFQPLFDTLNLQTGEREWNYSLDIKLEEYEFPKLGDIIIERA